MPAPAAASPRVPHLPRPFIWLMVSLLAFGGWSCAGPSTRLDLVELFDTARQGPITAFQGDLGSSEAAPFLVGPWETLTSGKQRGCSPGASLSFYLSEPLDLTVVLEGRARQTIPGQIRVNGVALPRVTLPGQWTKLTFALSASALKEGENRLTLDFPQAMLWRNVSVLPTSGGRSAFAGQQVGSYATRGKTRSLSLAFGSSVAYPLNLRPGGTLRIEKLEPWLDEGAAALQEPFMTLSIRLRCDDPPFDKSWRLEDVGRQSLSLPDDVGGRVELTLSAQYGGDGAPAPGQRGLLLTDPRVDMPASAQQTATPIASPTAPAGLPATPVATSTAPRVSPVTPVPASSRKTPNVLIYLVDTVRADHLSTYGYEKPTSPQLDLFARDGIVFENVLAEAPWTKPSTCTILTGLPSLDHGAQDFADVLPEGVQTLAELFEARGYQTAGFFTNPMAAPLMGLGQGFEHTEMELDRPSARVNEWVFPWLRKRDPKRPFFLYVHTIDPHSPYKLPPKLAKTWSPKRPQGFTEPQMQALVREVVAAPDLAGWKAANAALMADMVGCYDGEVASNDAAFGALLEELKSLGLYQDTLIVFTSDHGEELLDHGGIGHVHSMYRELLNVPWVLKLPGQKDAGTRVGSMACHLDIAPTVLAQAGQPIPATMRGRPYPHTDQGGARPGLAYVHTGQDALLARQAKSPYLLHAELLRVGHLEVIRTYAELLNKMPPLQLFDIRSDPHQQHNLIADKPVTALHMEAQLKRLQAAVKKGRQVEKASAKEVEESLRGLQYLR